MKTKKMIAAILIIVMGMTIMSGCKSKETGVDKEIDATADESGKIGGVMYAEGLPIVDTGEYSFTLFVDDSSEYGEYYIIPELEKQTGVKVDVQNYPYEIAKEKFSLDLSSGDYADCIGGWCLSDTDILTYGVQMGTFVPLEDYFEKYCPNITAILELEGVREAMTAPDGHIYSIPYVMEAPQVDFNPYINTRWLKNLGLEMPTTTEELREVLSAFKEQDANGNEDPNDEIPFAFNPDQKHLGYLGGWFGMSTDDFGFTMVDSQLTFGANTDAFKNGIQYLNSLYEEGLLDPEMFTQDAGQWKSKGGQDVYGVCMMYGSGDIMPYDAGEKPDWEPLPVLTSEECDNPVWLKSTYGTNVLKNQVVITDNAENPAAICRWWDNVMALENSIQISRGPLDIVVFKEDGAYRAIDTTTLSEEDQATYNWSNLWPQSLPKYLPNGFRFTEDNPPYEEKPVVDELYGPYLTKEIIPAYWVSTEDATRLSDMQTSIKQYITQKTAEWISGQSDIDADWDGYLKQLDKLKLKEYTEIRLKALSK